MRERKAEGRLRTREAREGKNEVEGKKLELGITDFRKNSKPRVVSF